MCGVAAQMMMKHFQLLSANGEHTKSQQQQKKQHKNAKRTRKIHCKLRMNINSMNVNGIVMPSRYILKLLLEWRMEDGEPMTRTK